MTAKAQVPQALRERVAGQARYRCGYCLRSEELTGMPMTVDHIVPEAAGGPTVEENLWLACYRCNEFKGVRTQARPADRRNGRAVQPAPTGMGRAFRLERRRDGD